MEHFEEYLDLNFYFKTYSDYGRTKITQKKKYFVRQQSHLHKTH